MQHALAFWLAALICIGLARSRQPLELVGYYQGACWFKAAATVDEKGGIVISCLPQDRIMTSPLVVWYVLNRETNKVTFSWWEDASMVQNDDGGPSYFMPGGHATSLSLDAWQPPPGHTPSMCINATFDSFSATYRAAVIHIGANDIYTEDGVYNTSSLELLHKCPERDNLPLYCDKDTFNYRCTASKADPPGSPEQLAAFRRRFSTHAAIQQPGPLQHWHSHLQLARAMQLSSLQDTNKRQT